MTRVLQVLLSLDPGGTERLVLEIVRRLRQEIPMAVCCLDDPGLWASELQSEGVTVTAFSRSPGFHPTLGRGVARAARAHGATVVHAHHYSPFVYSALARAWGSPPVVFTEHGRLSDHGPSGKRRMANRAFGLAVRQVYAVSSELRQHLIEEGLPPKRIGVIYNGIAVGPAQSGAQRLAIRARLRVDPDVFVVGTIARLDPVKDLGTLIEAVAAVGADTNARLVIVGEGTEREALERRAHACNIASRVTFLGHREDAREWLAGCDCYANSSISEGVSLTILEAMAAGLPIVATAVGGTPEIVDTTCGMLVPSRDAGTLAGALADLARSENRRQVLGQQARQRVEERFTIERMVHEYATAYGRAGQ